MGAAASLNHEVIDAELAKPADGSDVGDDGAAVAEVRRLRALLKTHAAAPAPAPAPAADEPPLVRFEPRSAATAAAFAALHAGTARLAGTSAEPLFHEAGVWIPSSREWLVTSNRLAPGTAATHVKVSAVAADGRPVRPLPEVSAAVAMANGGTSDGRGGALLLSQGLGAESGALYRISPDLSGATKLGPPDGVLANSFNDVCVHAGSGACVVTDPCYGAELQGFRTTWRPPRVWAVAPGPDGAPGGGAWTALADLGTPAGDDGGDGGDGGGEGTAFAAPNGCVLSPDGTTLYVSDVWSPAWSNGAGCPPEAAAAVEARRARAAGRDAAYVAAFAVDVDGGGLRVSKRRRLFDLRDAAANAIEQQEGSGAKAAPTKSLGFPDGLKVDVHGNLYCGCADGVRVYDPSGAFLGRFAIAGGVANLCFGGVDGTALLALSETRAVVIDMRVAGEQHLFSNGGGGSASG